jgi:hypothetical protein
MKTMLRFRFVSAVALALAPVLVCAQNHYPAGAEGIRAASLPPAGLYFRDYSFFYWSDKLPGGPPNFDVFALVNAPRLIWMTEHKILGADYGMDVIVPFGYTKLTAGGYDDSELGLGDIQLEPVLLSWHKPQWDFALAYGIWAPTGKSAAPPTARLGKGFWSHMLTAGATWYPDTDKTWSFSALSRYEIHTKSDDVPATPGETFTLEFGLAKQVRPGWDLGLVGYWQEQVGNGQNDGTPDERVYALGPELAGRCPFTGMAISLRYLREFEARQRPEGHTVTLTLTHRF